MADNNGVEESVTVEKKESADKMADTEDLEKEEQEVVINSYDISTVESTQDANEQNGQDTTINPKDSNNTLQDQNNTDQDQDNTTQDQTNVQDPAPDLTDPAPQDLTDPQAHGSHPLLPDPNNNSDAHLGLHDGDAHDDDNKTELDEETVNDIIHMVASGEKQIEPLQSLSDPLIHSQTYHDPQVQFYEEKGSPGKLASLKPNAASIARIPSPSAEQKEEVEKMELQRQASILKYPARMIRMSKVSMSARHRGDPGSISPYYPSALSGVPTRSSNYTAEMFNGRPSKVVRWDEATNHRPPLRIDMDTPSPCSYSPHLCRPLRENVAPAYTFGRRTFVEKPGGSRTSWQKTWFQSSNVWSQKADFSNDRSWPSPIHYPHRPTIGPKQVCVVGFPAYSIGVRREDTMTEKKAPGKERPAPGTYDPDKADTVTKRRPPAYTHGPRTGGSVMWKVMDDTPGPAHYSPRSQFVQNNMPSYTIRGIRRRFDQVQGPFSTPT